MAKVNSFTLKTWQKSDCYCSAEADRCFSREDDDLEKEKKITQQTHIVEGLAEAITARVTSRPDVDGLTVPRVGSRLFIAEFLGHKRNSDDSSRTENRLHWLDSWNI